jgi:hypothetical protein
MKAVGHDARVGEESADQGAVGRGQVHTGPYARISQYSELPAQPLVDGRR